MAGQMASMGVDRVLTEWREQRHHKINYEKVRNASLIYGAVMGNYYSIC